MAYLLVIGAGGEEPDQVGIAVALAELVAFGLAVVPPQAPDRPRRLRRWAGSTATVTAIFIVGAVLWLAFFQAHAAADASATAAGHTHAHSHDQVARAQAGVVMRPMPDHHATAEETPPRPPSPRGPGRRSPGTRTSTRPYARLRRPGGRGRNRRAPGAQAAPADGRTLDPRAAREAGLRGRGWTATLLGAVFTMERAGAAGPAAGRADHRWHAHNICVTVLPPGFGVASPFGGCPALSINLTAREMMHVWTVDGPGGPYAEGLDEAWVRAYHATHGRPFTGR